MAGNSRRRCLPLAVTAVVLVACATSDGGGAPGPPGSSAYGPGSVVERPLSETRRSAATDRDGHRQRGETLGVTSARFVVNDDLGIPVARQRHLVELVLDRRGAAADRGVDGPVGRTIRVADAYGGAVLVDECRSPLTATGTAVPGRHRWSVAPSVGDTRYVLGLLADGDRRLRWVVTDVRSVDGAGCR